MKGDFSISVDNNWTAVAVNYNVPTLCDVVDQCTLTDFEEDSGDTPGCCWWSCMSYCFAVGEKGVNQPCYAQRTK